MVHLEGFCRFHFVEPRQDADGKRRTYEPKSVISSQILPFKAYQKVHQNEKDSLSAILSFWCTLRDSNPRPTD